MPDVPTGAAVAHLGHNYFPVGSKACSAGENSWVILSVTTKPCSREGRGPSGEATAVVLLNGHHTHEMPSKSRCFHSPIGTASALAWEASFCRWLQLLQRLMGTKK